MVKKTKLVPGKGPEGKPVGKESIIRDKWLAARRRELVKAGFAENLDIVWGQDTYNIKELSYIDRNGYEAGLLSLPLSQLKKLYLIQGRRNAIKAIRRAYKEKHKNKEVMSWEEARIEAIKDYMRVATVGRLGEYIEYYYPKHP